MTETHEATYNTRGRLRLADPIDMDPTPTPTWLDPLLRLAAAAAGTVVSLGFIRGKTRAETALTAFGGVAFSWFAAKPVAMVVKLPNDEGLVGFLLGLFGMALLTKIYEVIAAVNAGGYAEILADWARRLTGSNKGEK